MNDRERRDGRYADDEDYPRERRDRPSRPRGKDLSVLGVISLVVGLIALVLSLIPCVNFFTWPLQIVGIILALVGVLISAIGQRDGLGIPATGLAVNLLACLVPVGMYLAFFGLMGSSVQQAPQQAATIREDTRGEAEHRDEMARKSTSVVGVFAAPQGGMLVGVTALKDVYPPPPVERPLEGSPPINVDQLLGAYEMTPLAADLKYGKTELRIQGVVERVKLDDNEKTVVVLRGALPGGATSFVECVFDDKDEPDAKKVKKGRHVILEGICDGPEAAGKPIRFHSCRVAN